MCDFFGWKESWDTDDEIPPVVKYTDDKAKPSKQGFYHTASIVRDS